MAKGTRRDSKGYALKTGESQRKDGRYSFGYTDRFGKRHNIYAKSLSDLRIKEKQIKADLDDGLDSVKAAKMTLNDMFDRYMKQKHNLKDTTKRNYIYTYDRFVRDSFGKLKLTDIRFSDIKNFYYQLIVEKQFQPETVDCVHTLIHPALQLAVRENLIRNNPSDGAMGDIKRMSNWKNKRHALSLPQQQTFMQFMRTSGEFEGWLPIVTVLLGTGMRIGECLGLRWEDLDFDNKTISVNHSYSYRPVDESGKSEQHIQSPKTAAGTRIIPMIDEVYEAFLSEYEIQKCIGFCEAEIDGYSGFIFSTSRHTLYNPNCVNRALHRAITACNKWEKKRALVEKREPVEVPLFSAHVLRHTFCTRLCENESNLKVIQSIMGHSDIGTTMDVYAEAMPEKKQEIMCNLQGKIIV